jgi:hypothetical protein
MNKIRKFVLVLQVPWILFFLYISYKGYDVGGDKGMWYAFLFFVITFPSCILAIPILRIIDSFLHMSPLVGHIAVAAFLFVFGYVQWFLFVPWVLGRAISYVNARANRKLNKAL